MKKIVHLCLANFFIDNYSYQENILSKYHKLFGHDVSVIASLATFDKNGNPALLDSESEYQNEYDIPVSRIGYKKKLGKINRTLRRYRQDVYALLVKKAPDIIFIHGCQFLDISKVAKYAEKYPLVKIYVDSHSDFSNSAKNWLSKNILHKIIWCHCAKKIEPYTEKFYGVLPARVDFLKNIYRLPPDKVELLVMGADDEKVVNAKDEHVRNEIREQYGISPDDFLIITGGKIDAYKKQTLLLMDAVKQINLPKVKLLVFGSVINELVPEIEKRTDASNIQYVGWIDAVASYRYFAASDLAVFPGRHSVFWEQVVGQGIPMLVKHWDGTAHVDLGGNVQFLHEDSVDEIADKLTEICTNPQIYADMKKVAQNEGMNTFSYQKIAERSIDSQ